MDAWQKYARARDQIYHYGVRLRSMHDDIPVPRRTDKLIQLMEMAEALVDCSKQAFEQGGIMVVQYDIYVPEPLPGFEDLDEELKKPRWDT